MTGLSECPEFEVLRRLMLGQIPAAEAELLGEHLLHCDRCAARVQSLNAEDPLIDAARAGAAQPDDPDSPRVEGLIARLQVLPAPAVTPLPKRSRPTLPDPGSSMVDTHEELYPLLAPPREPGEIGRLGLYRIRKVLGAGGMGVVFLAEDSQLQRPVALKVMKPSLATKASCRRRFLHEAQATAALAHDHIVAIYQVGEDRGVPFLAMQLLHGETLEDRLQREGNLTPAEVVRIGRETARGLAAAHAHDLIHRDVKPANLWLEAPTGRVKILDFGLARAIGPDPQVSQPGLLIGTPVYMAPEQARGAGADHRSDLFSLGCVLYRMCTGRLPFRGADTMAVLQALAVDTPKAPRALNREVPPALSELVMKLLAKRPEDRCQSPGEVFAALEASLRPRKHRLRPRRLAGFAAAGLLVVGGLLVTGVFLRREPAGALAPPVSVAKRDGEAAPPETSQVRAMGSFPGHAGPVKSLAFTPDGGRILSCSNDGTLRLWDVRTGQEVGCLRGHDGAAHCLALSADGRRVASAGEDATVRVWDLDSGRQVHCLRGPAARVWGVAWSRDGRWVLSGDSDGWVCLWDVVSGRELRRHREGRSPVFCVAFSPDGRRAVLGSWNGTVRVWDVESWEELYRCTASGLPEGFAHGLPVRSVAFSPDGRQLLSGSYDQGMHLWDATTGQQLRVFTGHTHFVHGLAFSPDGRRFVSGNWDQTVRVWDVASGKELYRAFGLEARVETVAFAPDGRHILSGGWDGKVRLWRLPDD